MKKYNLKEYAAIIEKAQQSSGISRYLARKQLKNCICEIESNDIHLKEFFQMYRDGCWSHGGAYTVSISLGSEFCTDPQFYQWALALWKSECPSMLHCVSMDYKEPEHLIAWSNYNREQARAEICSKAYSVLYGVVVRHLNKHFAVEQHYDYITISII